MTTAPAEPRTARTYRLPPDTLRQVAEIAAEQHGLKATQVIEWAVDHLHHMCRPAPAPGRVPVTGPARRPARKPVT